MANLGWMKEMLDTVDRMDAEGFSRFFAAGGTMRYGNGPSVSGPAGVREFSANFFAAINGISHRVLGLWETDGGVFCQGECTYQRKDGRAVTLPFLTLSKQGNAGLSEYLVYMDAAPIFAPA